MRIKALRVAAAVSCLFLSVTKAKEKAGQVPCLKILVRTLIDAGL
jgi:hypothetical protein